MPYHRAVSPFSLETYDPSADDLVSDELPASDDELTEAEHAAKRQRIEKLAESYLQGQPLFILSASLKGPFDQGWGNPWKKDRRAIVNQQAKKHGKRAIQSAGHVVQETDLRNPRYREDLAVAAPNLPAATHRTVQSPSAPFPNASSPITSRSAQKRPLQAATCDEQNRTTPRSIKKPKETTSSWRTSDHSFAAGGPADWLKKDRKRLNFTQIEPPSSPTPKIASRPTDNKGRGGTLRTLEVRVPATPSRMRGSRNLIVGQETIATERMDISPECPRLTAPVDQSRGPIAEKILAPGQSTTHQSSPCVDAQAASSFRVISSTSQLPRFEYRRWHQENNSPKAQKQSPVKDIGSAVQNTSVEVPAPVSTAAEEEIPQDLSAKETVAEVQDAPVICALENAPVTGAENDASAEIDCPVDSDVPVVTEQIDDAVVEPDGPEEPNEPLANDCSNGANENEPVPTSKDLRFVDEAGILTCIEEENQLQTEQNTYENLPSAQHVPAPLGVSDRIPSLHSTAMPRTNPDQNTEESSDTQLSTQAALLHAQRSFQEDLESPEPEFIQPAEPEDTVLGPDEESLLAHETPYGPQASEGLLNPSLQRLSKDRIQAMSTQCMIDAVTPYTFSTEKKQKAFRDLSPDNLGENRSEEPRITDRLAHSPRMPSPSQDHDYHTAHSSPHDPDQGPDPTTTHRSTTQGTLLPFALSGSTPTTAQDGQGAPQGAESFDLSQAIADAGSWLQQSFDFMKDISRSNQPARPT